jgi:hypothetical protein
MDAKIQNEGLQRLRDAGHDQVAKADGGKTNPVLLQKDMAAALYLIQRVLDYGCLKYDRGSWKQVELERWDSAQRRHQQKLDLGERDDDESGMLHRAHQCAGLIIMLSHEIKGMNIMELGRFKEPPQEHKQIGKDQGS